MLKQSSFLAPSVSSLSFKARVLKFCIETLYINAQACAECTIACLGFVIASKNPHISAAKQYFKNLVGNYYGINMRSLNAKFQPSSFKTEGGVKDDRHIRLDGLIIPGCKV